MQIKLYLTVSAIWISQQVASWLLAFAFLWILYFAAVLLAAWLDPTTYVVGY